MQGFLVVLQGARLAEDDLGLGEQVGQRCAQLVGDVGGEGREAGEGVFQAGQHGVERRGQLAQFGRQGVRRQARGQRAGGDLLGHPGHLAQRTQAAARHPGSKQGGGQGREADAQPDQPLHLFEEVLVVGDVQQQGQAQVALLRAHHPVGGVLVIPVLRVRQAVRQCAAAEPDLAVRPFDAQRQFGVALQLLFQCRAPRDQRRGAGHALQQLAEHRQLALQLLLVQLDEVHLAGAVEQGAGQQRHGGCAGGEQQGEAVGQRHQARASST